MITSEPGYKQTLKLLIGVCESLAAIPTVHPTANQQWRAIFSDGLIGQARDLLQEIEDYLHEGLGDGGWTPGSDADTVECEGVVRAVDLDACTLTVRVGDDMRDASGRFEEDLRDKVKAALDRRVRLVARRAVYPRVVQMEVLDDKVQSPAPVEGEAAPV